MVHRSYSWATRSLPGAGLAFVSFVVLIIVEWFTVPSFLSHRLFGGDPSAGLALGFFVVGAAVVLLPVNFVIAWLIALCVYIVMRPKKGAKPE